MAKLELPTNTTALHDDEQTRTTPSRQRLSRRLLLILLVTALVSYCLCLAQRSASGVRSLSTFSATTTSTKQRDHNNSNSEVSSSTSSSTAPQDVQEHHTIKRKHPVVDIIAIGSQTRPHYMDVQQETFASHPAVRNYIRFNELNDTEADCAERLTVHDINEIARKCRDEVHWNNSSDTNMNIFRRKVWNAEQIQKLSSHPIGWKCAQKRPIDALYKVLKQQYGSGKQDEDFPDYLMVMDDDTWINMPAVLEELQEHHPATEGHAVAGCRIRYARKTAKTTPLGFGGFSNIFSKPVLERFTKPVHCSSSIDRSTTTIVSKEDDFQTQVCARLRENLFGEGPLFEDGMSAIDLMYKYTFHHAFVDVASWDTSNQLQGGDSSFFCFHSDHVASTFVNYYYLANRVPLDNGHGNGRLLPHERTAAYRESHYVVGHGKTGECLHTGKAACTVDSHICHKPTPEHMLWLHAQQQQKTMTTTSLVIE